ncbi:MAG: hypothetical protein JSS02_16085 [Planctomycetes bacterium]|nr:hypothetical protein [Planctomycetota bacterium]
MNLGPLAKFLPETFRGRCGLLTVVCGAVWLLSLWPAYLLFGRAGIVATSTSALASLASGLLTFYVVSRIERPRMQAFGVLAGTFVRSAGALVAALGMHLGLNLAPDNYVVWLGLFYIITLALETIVLVNGPTSGPSS